MLRTLEEAQGDLQSYEEEFYSCVQGALAEFVGDHAPFRHVYSRRTQASIIHDLIRKHVRERFGGRPGVIMQDKGNVFRLHVGPKWVFKVKKLDSSFRSRNIPTQTVLVFLRQEEPVSQLELPGTGPRPTSLHLGYQLPRGNSPELLKSTVWVACPSGSSVAWLWPLLPAEQMPVAPPIPLRPEEPMPRTRVRIRKTAEADEAPAPNEKKSDGAE